MSFYENLSFTQHEKNIEKPRKSWEFFKNPKSIQIRNQTFYKPLKQPILGFQEGLFFVHRSSPKSKTASLTKSPKPKLLRPKDSPSPFKSVKTQKSKNHTQDLFDIIVKPSQLSVPIKQGRPKIIVKKGYKIKTLRFAKKIEDRHEVEELKAWNNESVSRL